MGGQRGLGEQCERDAGELKKDEADNGSFRRSLRNIAIFGNAERNNGSDLMKSLADYLDSLSETELTISTLLVEQTDRSFGGGTTKSIPNVTRDFDCKPCQCHVNDEFVHGGAAGIDTAVANDGHHARCSARGT
ncbi:hypothetical protein Tcan_11977 [Toxocara canis]|uniref:Uncharacterized protein n=1 Tax=Toxocara canis TaxID=6265 RepID=A0A0B2UQN6_TOXCA|nr:hypothetical protein Tcan_11977 [Toxocara canis]